VVFFIASTPNIAVHLMMHFWLIECPIDRESTKPKFPKKLTTGIEVTEVGVEVSLN